METLPDLWRGAAACFPGVLTPLFFFFFSLYSCSFVFLYSFPVSVLFHFRLEAKNVHEQFWRFIAWAGCRLYGGYIVFLPTNASRQALHLPQMVHPSPPNQPRNLVASE
eukprot:GGOE01010979.1.p2 GENE.GGOE01010979.1~~GGOE01010979.1.p2  ORF type:complete len:109 (-),score=0.68 GGOE01010979.1:690-1016(-)